MKRYRTRRSWPIAIYPCAEDAGTNPAPEYLPPSEAFIVLESDGARRRILTKSRTGWIWHSDRDLENLVDEVT